jgi:hypothetical protein
MRAGPKAEITAGPLDLVRTSAVGSRRVEQFARGYLKVTRGKGARGPFRLRAWQKDFVRRMLPGPQGRVPARRCCRCPGGMARQAGPRSWVPAQAFELHAIPSTQVSSQRSPRAWCTTSLL